jgi:hypothetical protein
VAAGQREHVHAGRAGGSDAVGSVIDGKAAARRDFEAPGCLGVQVGGRLTPWCVFPGDDRCELGAQAEGLKAGLDQEPAGARRYGAGQPGTARSAQERDDAVDWGHVADSRQEAGTALPDYLVMRQSPGAWQLGQQVADGQARMPEVPAVVEVKAVRLQCCAQRLLVTGRRVSEGAVEVEDHGLNAIVDRGMITGRPCTRAVATRGLRQRGERRWSPVRAGRRPGCPVHAGTGSARWPVGAVTGTHRPADALS